MAHPRPAVGSSAGDQAREEGLVTPEVACTGEPTGEGSMQRVDTRVCRHAGLSRSVATMSDSQCGEDPTGWGGTGTRARRGGRPGRHECQPGESGDAGGAFRVCEGIHGWMLSGEPCVWPGHVVKTYANVCGQVR